MAIPILVIGASGSGKSTSLRNLDPKKTIIISPNNKDLPFKGARKGYIEGKNMLRSSNLDAIQQTLVAISDNKPEVTTIVIEDLSHWYSARIFSPTFLSQNTGNAAFAKWLDFGASVYQALFAGTEVLRKDLAIAVLNHSEFKEDGTMGFKSSGKLLDNAIDVPSYYTWIFHAVTVQKDEGVEYLFQTNKDASRLAKTPMGAFKDLYVPNDLAACIEVIKNY